MVLILKGGFTSIGSVINDFILRADSARRASNWIHNSKKEEQEQKD